MGAFPQFYANHKESIMKIVIAADSYPPDVSGNAIFSQNLARGLRARGHSVHVIAPSPVSRPYIANVAGITEHRMRSHEFASLRGFSMSMPWEISRTVRRILQGLNPDVVHVQSHLSVGRVACKYANELGLPLIVTNHFTPENLFDRLSCCVPKFISKLLADMAWRDLGNVFQRADRLVAPSPTAIAVMKEHAHLGGGVSISNGVNLPIYQAAAQKAEKHSIPHLLYVGRLEKQKHVDDIITALALLQPSTKLHFDIVGTGTKKEDLRRKAAELRVIDRVTFHDYLDDDALIEMYARSDIFVNASTGELQSLATLEALSSGIPVVLANAVGLPHLVRPGVNGYLFQPGDVEALSDYLEDLAINEQKRKFMGKMSLEIAQPHDFENTLDSYEALYRCAQEENATALQHLDAIDPDYVFPQE